MTDGLRFAFYGRMSTKDHQDQQTSYLWQHDNASELIADHGHIVAEFFDVGYTRRLPWSQRPKARELLAALADPDKGFDAIVIGECERAFYGNQFSDLMPIFTRHGVQVWLPELCGPYDPGNPVHDWRSFSYPRSHAAKCCAPDSGPPRRCGHRPANKAATWVADHRTATGSPTPGRTPTAPTPGEADASYGLTPTRPPHWSSPGYSPSA